MHKLTLIFFLSVLFSCKKEKLITKLPQTTSNGQNTLGFLVAQKVWVPKWEKYTWGESCKELVAHFLPVYNQFELLGGIKINGNKSYFRLRIDSIFKSGVYSSNCTISIHDSNGMVIDPGGYYNNVGPNTSCNVDIIKLDTVNKIISGIFQARLRKVIIRNLNLQDINPNAPEYVDIRAGVFDVSYNYCR